MATPYPDCSTNWASPDTPHYGQLLYTSFDNVSGVGGGWQVKSESGDLTAAERQDLISRITTSFNLGHPLPQYPTPDQIQSRPARLHYTSISASVAAYWHTLDAGDDSTGRPGNVIAHVLLDRDIELSAHRPVQLWGSPDWCRAYGPTEVSAAIVPSLIPRPNPEINAASVVHFLADTSIDRQTVFRVLLDAVYGAMIGGPKVVLVTNGYETGPKWIAALSYFMSPGTARRFSWSSHDNAQQALANARRGTHLVVVNRVAVDDLANGDWLVLLEDDEPNVAEIGSRHRTTTAEIDVTPWSVLAEGVLADESTAVGLLAEQDAIAAQIGDRGLSPMWPLAVAVSAHHELAEFHADAQRAIADDAPADIRSPEWLGRVIAEAIAMTAPQDLADALHRLTCASQRGFGVSRAASNVLTVLLKEPGALETLQLDSIPVCNAVELTTSVHDLHQLLVESRWRGPDLDGANSLALLRLAELVTRLAVQGPALHDVLSEIRDLLRGNCAQVLANPFISEVLTADRDLSAHIRETVLRPALHWPSPELDRFNFETWRWLFGDEDAHPAQMAEPPANPNTDDLHLYPLYVKSLLEQTAYPISSTRKQQLADHAAFMALDADTVSDDDCKALLTRLATIAPLSNGELLDVYKRWPRRISPAAAASALCYQPVSDELIDAVLASSGVTTDGDPWSRCAIAAAQLRSFLKARPISEDSAVEYRDRAAPDLLIGVPQEHLSQLHPDVAGALAALFVAAQSRGIQWADPHTPRAAGLREALGDRSESATEFMTDLAEIGVIDATWLASQSLLGRFGPEFIAEPLWANSNGGRTSHHFADAVLSGLIRRGAYQAPRDLVALRGLAWEQVRWLTAPQAEEFFTRFHKVGKGWLHDFGS